MKIKEWVDKPKSKKNIVMMQHEKQEGKESMTSLLEHKKVALLLNGELLENLQKELAFYDYIVSADGASNVLYEEKMLPDLIIGDLDSITPEAKEFFGEKGVEFHKFPPEKDKTDSHLAVEELIENGAKHIFIYGGVGKRWDHSLGNIGLFYFALKRGVELEFRSEKNRMLCKKPGKYHFPQKEGYYFSILPMTDEVKGISIEGAKYDLKDRTIIKGETVGISNEYKEDILLSFKEGILLIIETQFDHRG